MFSSLKRAVGNTIHMHKNSGKALSKDRRLAVKDLFDNCWSFTGETNLYKALQGVNNREFSYDLNRVPAIVYTIVGEEGRSVLLTFIKNWKEVEDTFTPEVPVNTVRNVLNKNRSTSRQLITHVTGILHKEIPQGLQAINAMYHIGLEHKNIVTHKNNNFEIAGLNGNNGRIYNYINKELLVYMHQFNTRYTQIKPQMLQSLGLK